MRFPTKTPFLLDGGTGTNLYTAGMPRGVCVEDWVAANPAAILELQAAYAQAGCDAVMAPTFGAIRVALGGYGFAARVGELNHTLVALSRQAVAGKCLVAGDVSLTGLFPEPFGESSFDEIYDVYLEQFTALREAGADYVAVETLMSLTDARMALLAAKRAGLPVTVTFTVEPTGRTLSGGDMGGCLLTLATMGADAVGLNCSTGPDTVAKALAPLLDNAILLPVPVIAKPNAGLPKDGAYELTPELFAEQMRPLLLAGAEVAGGCCGTTPAHMAALRALLGEADVAAALAEKAKRREAAALPALPANERGVLPMPARLPDAALECGPDLEDGLPELDPDEENACALIRVRGEAEAEALGCAIHAAQTPVCVLADSAAALRAALLRYNGRALVDRRSGAEQAELESIAGEFGGILF